MSLPRVFGTTLDTVPAKVPYLSADPSLVEYWGRELRRGDAETRGRAEEGTERRRDGGTKGPSVNSALSTQHSVLRRIGVAWQAEQRTLYGRQRSVPLAHFAVLSQVPGVRLISLQKGWKGSVAFPITVFPDLDGAHGAFMDSAAIMKHLDLVITADTSVAHLAGALGVPVWVAVRHTPDWRWMLDRQDSPWYPTMRLFRQSRPGVWRHVFERVATELVQYSKE